MIGNPSKSRVAYWGMRANTVNLHGYKSSLLPCSSFRRRYSARNPKSRDVVSESDQQGNIRPRAVSRRGQRDVWGNRNRLAAESGDEDSGYMYNPSWRRDKQRSTRSTLKHQFHEIVGRFSYMYYNWREDTFSDLQLLLVSNFLLLGIGSAIRSNVEATDSLWESMYSVLVVILGQELPSAQESELPAQVFAVVTAVLGLALFALILALIEQVVLETLESNVKRGSKVYESGHYCLVAWGESSRDIEQLQRIVLELCSANRRTGGATIAILVSHREKLELESVFRQGVPAERRYGSQIVCRKGSPLDPSDLDMISATTAKSVIICGDYSISCRESDAVVLRAAVLLDEAVMAQQGQYEGAGVDGRGAPRPHIVAEIQSKAGLELLNYACSPNVKAVPTTRLNTARTVRLLKHPVTAVVSHQFFDNSSRCHVSLFNAPLSFQGKTLSDLMRYFPYAIPMGFFDESTRRSDINADPERTLKQGEMLILLQSTHFGRDFCLKNQYIDIQDKNWDPRGYIWNSSDVDPVVEKSDHSSISGRPIESSWTDDRAPMHAMYAMIGSKQAGSKSPRKVLVCGWPGRSYTSEIIKALDSRDGLPFGSSITLVNNHKWEKIQRHLGLDKLRNITVAHVQCDPRDKDRLGSLIDVSEYSAAIIMQDTLWVDDSGESQSSAAYALSQADMLRLDAAILTVQLNIRFLLEETRSSEINIIAEKLASEGETRFENRSKLPLGASISSSSFSAKSLTLESLYPGLIDIYINLRERFSIYVQDASSFVKQGEEISFATLQARCASVQQVLLGYYYVPRKRSTLEPINLELNPQGVDERCRKRVWNSGDGSCKLIVGAPRDGGNLVQKMKDEICMHNEDFSGCISDLDNAYSGKA